MSAAIVVPWRGGVPSREAAWAKVRAAYDDYGLPVVTGDSDPALPFNLRQARNRVAEAAGYVDAYVFNDADIIVPRDSMLAAIDLALDRCVAVWPADRAAVRDHVTGEDSDQRLFVGGTIVVPRVLFEAVGGWDERFVGYGWEDYAFRDMLHHLSGRIERVPGHALWFNHERRADETEEGRTSPLLDRYKALRTSGDVYRMADEVRAARTP